MEEPKQIGNWLFICVLGSGAFGKVTLWRNSETEEHIAVKKCRLQILTSLSSRQRERWINEVEIMKDMKNDNIIAYKELPKILEEEFKKYNPSKLPILSMEYCSKGNLRKYLCQMQNMKGCEESDVRCILEDIGNAISHLHSKNITHRDIKPENIVIKECDTRHGKNIYKLIDLGYAKELETLLSFVGTLPYIAPEIFYNVPYTNNVDYWSLGILTYEIITGEHPFLINKSPVERFQYLKKKSDEDISICVSQNGTPKYSKTIAVENQLSSIFKRDIENWLKPLLVFDSRKRGNYSEEKTDVFKELDVLLKKKIITIYSVFNYCTVDYEITETTRLSNIKSSIENDFCIPRNKQMFILDKQMIICDDNIKLMELFKDINQRTMFVFKKDSDFNARVVTIPQLVQALFQPINTQVVGVIKKLYTHAIFFINQEEKLLEQFQTALLLQIEHTNLLFKTVKKLHSNIRNKLIKLITQTECFSEFNEVQKPNFAEDEEYKNYLAESRRYLRQAKELIENFNSLTGRLLKILNTEWVSNYTESLRNALNSTDVDMKNMYKNATTLYQKLSPSNFYSIEMMKILSNVLQLPRTAIFSNDDLKKYIKSSLYAQRSLLKLLPWCKAIDGEVQKVSSLLLNSEKSKYEIVQRICSKPNKVTITVPNDCSNIEELNDLIKENLNLRYKIQEVSDEGSMYIRHLQKNMIYFWNDVISRKNPK